MRRAVVVVTLVAGVVVVVRRARRRTRAAELERWCAGLPWRDAMTSDPLGDVLMHVDFARRRDAWQAKWTEAFKFGYDVAAPGDVVMFDWSTE